MEVLCSSPLDPGRTSHRPVTCFNGMVNGMVEVVVRMALCLQVHYDLRAYVLSRLYQLIDPLKLGSVHGG